MVLLFATNIIPSYLKKIIKKKGISNRHEAIENGKIFWRENSLLTFHICDNIYPSQLNFFFFIFLIEFVFTMNMLTVVNS